MQIRVRFEGAITIPPELTAKFPQVSEKHWREIAFSSVYAETGVTACFLDDDSPVCKIVEELGNAMADRDWDAVEAAVNDEFAVAGKWEHPVPDSDPCCHFNVRTEDECGNCGAPRPKEKETAWPRNG